MAYTPKTWADGAAGGTPVTAFELNRIEGGIQAASGILSRSVKTADYTLTAADLGTVVEFDSASNLTLTVPSLTAGGVVEVYRAGTGTVTIVSGTGVTLRPANSQTLRAQYSSAGIRYRTTTEVVVSGDLT